MATIAAGQGAAAGQPATWPVDAARDSDEPFRTLAATMPGICWLARQDGRIYWMNGHGRDFFGTTERNPFAALHPDDRPATLAAWRLAAAQGHAFEATTRLRAPDGSWRPFLTRAEPVHDEAGSVLRWCGVQLDLSDQQRRQSHDAFFRAVSDAVRDESDPTRIIAVIAGLLEAHLAVGRVLYLETDGDPGRFTVSVNGTLRQAEVEYRPPAGFAAMLTAFGAGHTVATPDAGIVGGLITAGVRQFLLDHQARAGIGVPLVKDGRLVAILAAADPAPRRWTPEEVALIEELAELTWSTVTRARAVATLRERERQQAFMIAWSDAVRHKPSVHAILATTLDLLGRQLGAARLTYVEADARSVALAVDQHGGNATDPPRPPLPIAALGRRVVAHHLDERLLAVADVRDHPLFDGDNLPAFEAAGVRAFVAVPLVRHGKLAALLSAQADQPRAWTTAEVRLMAEVADRAWPMLQRARFEERLAESEAQLAAFMEHAPVGMHLKDRDGRYLRVNPELAVAVGRPMDELVGQHPDALFPDDMAARIVAMEARALAGSPVAEEFATASTDRYATLLSIVFPIGDDARKTGGFTLDLTERKAAEAALQRSRDALYQSEKLSALGSLLAGVSHELNNPLSIVVAQAVMMERHAEGTALADRALKIRKAADRCARIVQTFLAMARQKKPERSAVDLNAVANGAIELASYGLRSDGVGITRALAVDLPHISADSDQLHQIVTNLIVNAQQAMAGVGSLRWLEVRTALGPEPRTVILEVADSGPGIPPDMRRRVFEPFYTTKPQGEGTGVGLSFSQGLAEAHGGRLTLVPSERGACFRLTLPLDERDLLPRVEPTAAKPAAAAHRRALLVDDEEEIALSLADFLSLEGFECEVVVGGAAAQARLAQGQHYDLVVSDIRMPDVDGPALYAWIAVQRPDLAAHTAFTTGDTLGTAAARFLADARRPVLEKPFMPDSIRHFLAELELA